MSLSVDKCMYMYIMSFSDDDLLLFKRHLHMLIAKKAEKKNSSCSLSVAALSTCITISRNV